jgi:RHS repeat-associated protein
MLFKPGWALVLCLVLLAASGEDTFADDLLSVIRSGNDQMTSATIAGHAMSFAYDATYGQLTAIADADKNGYSLSFDADALLHLPVTQTVKDQANGDTVFSAAIAYGADGLRASRRVSAGSAGEGSSTTDYWYGGSLHPLVVERDGVNYRLIGKGIVEEVGSSQVTRSYAHADHSGSVRLVTDDQGDIVQSLSYDDYGSTSIAGQGAASGNDAMASFYRFQGQEQEIFPLAKLGIENEALGTWLDQIQLYRFPWRDYAAGLAAFMQTDPVPAGDSLYAAFDANPVNFTDETGGMVGGADDDDGDDDRDAYLVSLLDRILQHPLPAFSDNDRALLLQARRNINAMLQQLVDRSEAISRRIHDLDQNLRQMESSLQGLRQREAYAHYFRLIGDHMQQRRLSWHNMSPEDRTRYLNTILYTAQDISDRRMSVAQRTLSERYLLLIRSRDQLIEELDTVSDLQRDQENWLDIYDVPIRRLDPDEYFSDAEADEEEDEDEDDDDDDLLFDDDLGFQIHVGADRSPQHSDSEDDVDAARAQENANVNDSGNRPNRSPGDRGAHRDSDGGALE